MRWLLPVGIGVAILWFLPGLVAACVCLTFRKLRNRAIQLHCFALDQSIAQYLQQSGKSPQAARVWHVAREQRWLQLILIALVLIFSGPSAIGRLRMLARSRNEIRLE